MVLNEFGMGQQSPHPTSFKTRYCDHMCRISHVKIKLHKETVCKDLHLKTPIFH